MVDIIALNSNTQIQTFLEALNDCPDPRDNRGKTLDLPFVIVSVVMAILSGRSTMSSIFRYMENQCPSLQVITGMLEAQSASRAQLPRLLNRLNWSALNQLIEQHFNHHIERNQSDEWIAIDGKVLRGTLGSGEKQAVVLAVSHESKIVLAQSPQVGKKSSEIPVVRELIKSTRLACKKLTLDAHHCNPKTTQQIHQADGQYLIQVKNNQPTLLKQLKLIGQTDSALFQAEDHEKAHGRMTTRCASIFSLTSLDVASRWQASTLQTLVVIERESLEVKTQKVSHEIAYYISNQSVRPKEVAVANELVSAIRKHWGVESENWIRDVTFNEDKIRTKFGNQAQILASLRSLAMTLLRQVNVINFQATIERFIDIPGTLESFLKQVKFL